VNSILGDWSLFIFPLSPCPLPFPSSLSKFNCRSGNQLPRETKTKGSRGDKEAKYYIHTTLTDTPNQKCQFLAPNHQGAFFVGGGGGG
jgi:hypothetical protein